MEPQDIHIFMSSDCYVCAVVFFSETPLPDGIQIFCSLSEFTLPPPQMDGDNSNVSKCYSAL